MGKLLLSHRSTKYPCFVPNLGESMGAGRKRLTRHKSRKKILLKKDILLLVLTSLIVNKNNFKSCLFHTRHRANNTQKDLDQVR
jgi:hypothetical protein